MMLKYFFETSSTDMSVFRILGHPFMRGRISDWNKLPIYVHNDHLDVRFSFGEFYNVLNWSHQEDCWHDNGMDTIMEVAEVELRPQHDGAAISIPHGKFIVARFKDVESATWFKLTLPEEMGFADRY